MPDQSTLTGKDGKVYTFDPADKITQAELDAAIDAKAKTSAPPSIGSQLLDKTVEALPGIGSIIGGGAGFVGGLPTGPGDVATTLGGAAIGGAGGAYVRDAINQLRGKIPQQSLGQAAGSQLGAANDAATSTMLPAILGGFRRPAQTAAQDAYQSVSGIGDSKLAGKILDEGRGTLRSSNTAALKAAEDATNVPAVKPRVRSIGMGVKQISPGRPAIPGPLAGAAEAHGTATMRPISPAEKAIPAALGGGIGYVMGNYPGAVVGGAIGTAAAPLVRPAISGLAQGAYNAAGQAGPIGELLRLALMSYLFGEQVSVEAWVSLIVMALFNVLSTAFYIGVNKQMLNEVMRRVTMMEMAKAEKEFVSLHVQRIEEEQARFDREMSSVRQDVRNILNRRRMGDDAV